MYECFPSNAKINLLECHPFAAAEVYNLNLFIILRMMISVLGSTSDIMHDIVFNTLCKQKWMDEKRWRN